MLFTDLKLPISLLRSLSDLGFESPTPIQQKAIPVIKSGKDVIGIAQTGTGKTATYLIPLILKLKQPGNPDPRALILVPTRELSLQVAQHFQQLNEYTKLKVVALYGGVGPKKQLEELDEGCDVIISTTGRFMDLYLDGHITIKSIKTLIIDEADRMMDMGFMPQINRILEVIPSRGRQNLLFSATFPPKVETLCEDFLEAPERIEADLQATTAQTIKQAAYEVPNFKTKLNLLVYLLDAQEEGERSLVFVKNRLLAENIFKYVDRKYPGRATVIHANKGQNTRLNAAEKFRDNEVSLLIATDVVARGIDIAGIAYVYNFDVPTDHSNYVHRIGRTGRALHSGEAITFVNMAEKIHFEKIEGIIRRKIELLQLPTEVHVTETPFEEMQTMLREIDEQRKKADPDFQGAFHTKKKKVISTSNATKKPASKKPSGDNKNTKFTARGNRKN
jgi:ATP-dependent RNA helicase RhlE